MKKKPSPPAEAEIPVRRAVDELLLDHGRYEPLDLLQREGRLLYHDYEAWRGGEAENLDELLMGDSGAILTLLETAANYARALGLQPESIAYTGWGQSGAAALAIHSETRLARAVGTVWRRAEDQPQLDLFIDAPATGLSNALREALASRDAVASRELLEKLYDVDAAHAELAMLETLVAAQANAARPVGNVAAELQTLREDVMPAAHALLGNRAHDYATPLWRRLSAALRGQPFDPNNADCHRSYTDEQCRDWRGMRDAIETESGWHQQPILLARHIRACTRLSDEPASQTSCFRLCWRYSDQSRALMAEYPSALIKAEWRRFLDEDRLIELTEREFPAWMLIQFPALCRSLPEWVDDVEPERYADYRLVHRLQQMRAQALDDVVVTLRSALKRENPRLFDCFMALARAGARSP